MVGTMRSPALSRAARFGGDVRTTNLDLALSALIALGLPPLAAWLRALTGGALISLAVYYGVACVLVVRWRKGTLDYRRPARWPPILIAVGLALFAAVTALNWGRYPDQGAAPLGLLLTAVVWAPLNGAMEQLSWLYVLDAWRNRWHSGWKRWAGLAVGVLLLLTFVSLIHMAFWAGFLPARAKDGLGWVTPLQHTLVVAVYALLYVRSRSMWPVFLLHTLIDLQLVLLANYSIGPSL